MTASLQGAGFSLRYHSVFGVSWEVGSTWRLSVLLRGWRWRVLYEAYDGNRERMEFGPLHLWVAFPHRGWRS